MNTAEHCSPALPAGLLGPEVLPGPCSDSAAGALQRQSLCGGCQGPNFRHRGRQAVQGTAAVSASYGSEASWNPC